MHMLTSMVGGQGQTTVPAGVRRALKAPPGTVLRWAVNGCTAKVVPLKKANQRKSHKIDYEAVIKSWKESPVVPGHLLKIRRSNEP